MKVITILCTKWFSITPGYIYIYIILDLKWIIRANDSWSANKSSNISTPETCPQKIFHSCNYPNMTSTKNLIPTVAPMWARRTSTYATTPSSAQSNKTKQVCLGKKRNVLYMKTLWRLESKLERLAPGLSLTVASVDLVPLFKYFRVH